MLVTGEREKRSPCLRHFGSENELEGGKQGVGMGWEASVSLAHEEGGLCSLAVSGLCTQQVPGLPNRRPSRRPWERGWCGPLGKGEEVASRQETS